MFFIFVKYSGTNIFHRHGLYIFYMISCVSRWVGNVNLTHIIQGYFTGTRHNHISYCVLTKNPPSIASKHVTEHCIASEIMASWGMWLHFDKMTSSNGNIFHTTGHLCGEFTSPGEFPAQRPVTQSFDVFFDLCLNKRLSKQSWGWWFEMLSHPLWRHCN